MLKNKIRNIASLLLVLYIGYFSCVSYFVHTHIYQGVIYVHSHPYIKKSNADKGDRKLPPFETHNHTAAGFFTLNQLSSLTTFEADSEGIIQDVFLSESTHLYKELSIDKIIKTALPYFDYRAPPFIS